MKVAVYSAQAYDRQYLQEAEQALSTGAVFSYLEVALSPDTAILASGCDAICVFVNDRLDAPTLTALHALGVRAVLLRCAGFNQVDRATAASLGLFVARVPAYSPEAVAEHALALVMTLNRKTHRAYNRVRESNFSLAGLIGMTLHGKTVGVIGLGKIGQAVARIFRGMGCVVLASDPVADDSLAVLVERVPLQDLLQRADIVSLHCPLTTSTQHLIDRAALARMKLGAMLINTSRGALVDTLAVIDALKERTLGSLGIDVYEQEAGLFFRDHSGEVLDDEVFQRLLSFPNVLVTGHQGFLTVEALREISETTLRNLRDFMAGRACGNAI